MNHQDVDEYLLTKFKQFRLVDFAKDYHDIINEAEENNISYKEFLLKLVKAEDIGKTQRRQAKLLKRAKFVLDKELSDIDYSFNPSLDKNKIDALGKANFIGRHENIIIIGPPGVGKSLIATGIGKNACKKGYKVLFVSASELINHLYQSMKQNKLAEELNRINKIPLLIIDELSYLKMDKERESIFFQIISQRYEKSSLIITTNLPLGQWDSIFTGQIAATAIIDRLIHHCHIISITGDSYRVKGKVG